MLIFLNCTKTVKATRMKLSLVTKIIWTNFWEVSSFQTPRGADYEPVTVTSYWIFFIFKNLWQNFRLRKFISTSLLWKYVINNKHLSVTEILSKNLFSICFAPLPHTQKWSQKSPPRIRLKVVLKSFRSWSLVARNLSFCTYKSSQRRCSVRKDVLRNSQENTCARVSFLIKRLWHRFFPVNFVKFLWTPFLTEHLRTTASAHTKLITIAAMKIIITSNEWVEFLTIE